MKQETLNKAHKILYTERFLHKKVLMVLDKLKADEDIIKRYFLELEILKNYLTELDEQITDIDNLLELDEVQANNMVKTNLEVMVSRFVSVLSSVEDFIESVSFGELE